MRRNALAVAELADACVRSGTDLVLVSTNEVFDGRRTDGLAYTPKDGPRPGNPYGASKLAGETAAQAVFLGRAPQLALVRTAWLYGPPGNDFPVRILAAADRARVAAEPLRVVGDEIGSPTFAPDLAEGILDLLASGTFAGIHHIVNAGAVSRAGWARHVLAALGVEVPIVEISLATWTRPSTPPAWSVLAPTALPSGESLRPWQAAFADYRPFLARERAGATRR
jgi:dTDP-4-dehydrorhamnose reductase